MEPVGGGSPAGSRQARFSIGVPGMTAGQSIGLGSVLKTMTSAVGVRPCSGCSERAARLDRFVEFRGRDGKGGCCG